MEIKIWNTLVKSCPSCPYFNNDGMCCNLDIDLVTTNEFDSINSECPFLQRVTPENLFILGFEYFGNKEGCSEIDLYFFVANGNKYGLFIENNLVSLFRNSEMDFILKDITIDNFEHLKFVLSLTELKDLLTWK